MTENRIDYWVSESKCRKKSSPKIYQRIDVRQEMKIILPVLDGFDQQARCALCTFAVSFSDSNRRNYFKRKEKSIK